MGLRLWKKNHLIRRFGEPVAVEGYVAEDYEDIIIKADVQTTSRMTNTETFGERSFQQVKMFSDFEINVSDDNTGVRGDWLWFQNKWFQCTSSRLSENTFLKHWTSTFTECLNQADPPEVSV